MGWRARHSCSRRSPIPASGPSSRPLSRQPHGSRRPRPAGLDVRNHWYWLEKDPAYADAFARAVQLAADSLEDRLIELGTQGYEEGVWFKGELVGTQRRFLPTLLLAAVNAALPDKYRWRGTATHEISTSMQALQQEWLRLRDAPPPPPRQLLAAEEPDIIDMEPEAEAPTPVKGLGLGRSQSKRETFKMLDQVNGEPDTPDGEEDEPDDAPLAPAPTPPRPEPRYLDPYEAQRLQRPKP